MTEVLAFTIDAQGVAHSEINGLSVAWDTCGSCAKHITVCDHDVPIEPSYIKRWREEGEPRLQTVVSGRESSTRSHKVSGGLVSAGKSNPATFNVLDLVDDELIQKVKDAKQ